jgi:hypothetical protein
LVKFYSYVFSGFGTSDITRTAAELSCKSISMLYVDIIEHFVKIFCMNLEYPLSISNLFYPRAYRFWIVLTLDEANKWFEPTVLHVMCIYNSSIIGMRLAAFCLLAPSTCTWSSDTVHIYLERMGSRVPPGLRFNTQTSPTPMPFSQLISHRKFLSSDAFSQ